MSQILGTAYATLTSDLDRYLSIHASWPSPDYGFAIYALNVVELEPWPILGKWDWTATSHRLSEAPILASAGYMLAAAPKFVTSNIRELWAEYLARVSKRDPFPIDRESFFFRPQELLGLCVGAVNCPEVTADSRAWLMDVLERGERRVETTGVWSHTLAALAGALVGVSFSPASSPLVGALELSDICLLRWVNQHPQRPAKLTLNAREIDEAIVTRVFTENISIADFARAAIVKLSTGLAVGASIQADIERAWPQPKGTAAAVELVIRLCRRFPFLANRLESRHAQRDPFQFKDEYDLQDVLHGILKLHFEDVRPEEPTPSTGGSAARMDFLLKRERVVVEAKMARKGLDQKEIFKQLSEDVQRYVGHPDCDVLVCLVYDPRGLCHHPAALENDLTKRQGNLDVVVIVEPKLN